MICSAAHVGVVGARWPPWSSKSVAGRAERAAVGSTPIHSRPHQTTIVLTLTDHRLTSSALYFDFDPVRARFSIGRPNAPPLIRDAYALAQFDSCTSPTRDIRPNHITQQSIDDMHGRGLQMRIDFKPELGIVVSLFVTAYAGQPFITLRLSVENQSIHPQALRRLVPLHAWAGEGATIKFSPTPSALAFFVNGYQSWSYSGVRFAQQHEINTRLRSFTRPAYFNLTTPTSRTRGVFWSEMFGALIDRESRQALIAGQISCADQFAQVGVDTRLGRASLTMTCDLDGVPLEPGDTISSEEMFIQIIDLPSANPFATYIDAVARGMQPRQVGSAPLGWCSWYDTFYGIDEAQVLKRLQPQPVPIDLIQIDDGFSTKAGDWLSINDRFPHGMAWLAKQIRATDRRAGIWVAPFSAVRSSLAVQQHPDWWIHDQRGQHVLTGRNWGEPAFGLDTTHPAAQDHLRRMIETMVREGGYDYLKLDFLYAAAMQGIRYDQTRTRAQALRKGLELIRDAAGDDTFILGCGCPLGQAIGVVDAMRIGPDIAPEPEPSWLPRYHNISLGFNSERSMPSARNAIRNVLTRTAMHRKWWLNDPDCSIVRPARFMNETEVRSWASVVGLSGGLLMSGDDLNALAADRLRYIEALLPVLGEPAVALDMFEREMPELFMLRQHHAWGSGVLLGVFNWDDRPRRKLLNLARFDLDPFKPHHAVEFWSGRYQRVTHGELDVGVLPAHGCVVLALRPVLDRPHLVATTFHLTMGGEVQQFSTKAGTIEMKIKLGRRAKGEVWLAGCQSIGAAHDVRVVARDVWAISMAIDRSAAIDVAHT